MKKTSNPIAFGSLSFTFSIIPANTDLLHGNCPNLPKLFSSISIMTTLESCFTKGNVFWYKSKLIKEIDFTKLGLIILSTINKIKRTKKIK